MLKPFQVALLLSLVAGIFSGNALADGDIIIFQVRTDGVPGVQFDSIRTEVSRADPPRIVGTFDHVADPARDYGTGVRVAEVVVEAIEDFRATVSLRLGGGIVTSRPVRFRPDRHGHPHDWYAGFPDVKVITVLLTTDFVPINPVSKSATLELDNDGNGVVSPGDVLRYDVNFAAVHGLGRGSAFRDIPDADVNLLAGTVSTSHGTVFRGNFPADTDIEVRFGIVPADESVSVSYLVHVCPEIENQGLASIRLLGATVSYDVLTDDPVTGEPDDPTVVSLGCSPQVDPLPKPGAADVFPTEIPQNIAGSVTIQGAGFGTLAGAPTFTMNDVSVETKVLLSEDNQTETVSVTLTPEQVANAGLFQFTLTPADPNLPAVTGLLGIRAAPETPQEIIEALDQTIKNRVRNRVHLALDFLQEAQRQADANPDSHKVLEAQLKTDLARVSDDGAEQIIRFGNGALQQAAAADASEQQLRGILNAVDQGVALQDRLVGEIGKRFKKFTRDGKGRKGSN